MSGLTPVDYVLAALAAVAVVIVLCSACWWLIDNMPDPGRRAFRPRPEKPLRPEDADTVMFVRAAGNDVLADYARDTGWLELDVPRPGQDVQRGKSRWITGPGHALHGLNHARGSRRAAGSSLGESTAGHAPHLGESVGGAPDVPGQEASGEGSQTTATGQQHHGLPRASNEGEAGSPGRAPRRDPDAPFGRHDDGSPVVKYGLRRDGRPRQTPPRQHQSTSQAARPLTSGNAKPVSRIRRSASRAGKWLASVAARLAAFLRRDRPARFWSARNMAECARTAALIAYAESILPGGAA